MSLEQFSKLSLAEDMVTTRAGAARAARTGSGSSHSSDAQPVPSVESPTPNSPTPSLVISTNNLHYNVSSFNTDQRRRVKRGVEENEIKMKYCALSTNQDINGTKYFYIDDDITVAIGGKLRQAKCNCGANEKGQACKHIYWLADQVLSAAGKNTKEQPLQFSPDGSTIESLTPVDILNNRGLDSIAGERKWVIKKEDLPDDDDDMKDELSNMLSVFEPEDALPGDFKYPESPLASERSRKYQEFAKLVIDYAIRDPGLFLQVRDVIDPNFQQGVFFEKIESSINRTFHALDEYIAHGPLHASPDALRFDVTNCAKQLRSLNTAIDDFCHEQDSNRPETRDVANRAAAALITILDRVVDRNINAYTNITWGLEAPLNPRENNLFTALIGSHAEGDPPFILNTLRSLPQEDVLRNHWEMLQSIEQKLSIHDAPPDYANAFRRVVHDSRKRYASEVREGEPKRAMQV